MRLIRPAIALATALAIALPGGNVARAEDPKAQAALSFRAGSEAYARHDYRTAARLFDEAYRIVPRGAAAYNAGLAWESAEERARAADDYTRALEASDLGAAERADAMGRLRALVARASSEQAVKPVEAPATTETPPAAAEEPPVEKEKDQDRASRARTQRDDAASAHEEHAEHATARGPDRTAMWVTLGGAAVAAGVALTLFELGLTARNEFEAGQDTSTSQRNQAIAYRTGTWVAWGVAGGLAATGIVLFLANPSPSSTSQRAASPTVAFDSRGVRLRLPF
ncbi:MAG: hypothetical protein ABSE49_21755 [Polyangiaceae bacterium]|jgi:tetratricopeptide (TPR) repeat protein